MPNLQILCTGHFFAKTETAWWFLPAVSEEKETETHDGIRSVLPWWQTTFETSWSVCAPVCFCAFVCMRPCVPVHVPVCVAVVLLTSLSPVARYLTSWLMKQLSWSWLSLPLAGSSSSDSVHFILWRGVKEGTERQDTYSWEERTKVCWNNIPNLEAIHHSLIDHALIWT